MNDLLRRLLFLPPQASTVARSIDLLHYFVILTTFAGATLVTVVGGWFVIRYRRRPDDPVRRLMPRTPATLEACAVAGLAILFLSWWWVGLRKFVELRVAPAGALEIYVTGKQWMWAFAYPQGNRSIGALYVPAGRPVKLILTSRDVVHSFFVPDFRVKEDAVPGRYTTLWFEVKAPGRHEVLCTQYCGTGHSTMRAEVVALTPLDFETWLRGDATPDAVLAAPRYVAPEVVGQAAPEEPLSLVRMGERVAAERGCLRCHTLDGSRHLGPTWAGMYLATVPLEGGATVVADEGYLTESMMDPAAKVHRGFLPVMPTYLGRLRPAEVGALLELMKSLRDVAPEPGARDPRPQDQVDGGPSPL